MEQALGGAPPAESEATCADCVMCQDPPEPGVRPFHPEVKCCTYVPELPSFLVGAILADDDAPGRTSVEARIDARAGVTPLGLFRTPEADGRQRRVGDQWGRAEALRCPHYQVADGSCGIWRHRDAVCATWFCRHERGYLGFSAWHTLKQLLAKVEERLALWCAAELDLDLPALRALVPPEAPKEGPEVTDAAWAERWRSWAGREREFFRRAAGLVADLSWDDVVARCGLEVPILLRAAREAWGRLERPVPERLELGAFQTAAATPLGIVAVTYSTFNPIALPTELMRVLDVFDGRPTDEAQEALAERGLALDDEFLRLLVDYRVLVEPDGAGYGDPWGGAGSRSGSPGT